MLGRRAFYKLLGIEECQDRIYTMIEKAKAKAGIEQNESFLSLGLSMSGCEQKEGNKKFESIFINRYPGLTKIITVTSDTVGSILTASPQGGLVLIAGTGSNSLLLNPDGTTARCGGWGHLLGDEGSAIWISMQAVKMVFDAEDNFNVPSFDVQCAKKVMLEHFKVKDKFGILEHCYVNFNKSYFAGLCQKLAKAAIDDDDPFCKHLFYKAGVMLGDHVVALVPRLHPKLLHHQGGLPIICVGSVFKSWNLLQEGFFSRVNSKLAEYTLLKSIQSPALGSAYFAAKTAGYELPIDFSKNSEILYHFKA